MSKSKKGDMYLFRICLGCDEGKPMMVSAMVECSGARDALRVGRSLESTGPESVLISYRNVTKKGPTVLVAKLRTAA